jgi:hypothetical protein
MDHTQVNGITVLHYMKASEVMEYRTDEAKQDFWELAICMSMGAMKKKHHLRKASLFTWILTEDTKTMCNNSAVYEDNSGGLVVLEWKAESSLENLKYLGPVPHPVYAACLCHCLKRKWRQQIRDFIVIGKREELTWQAFQQMKRWDQQIQEYFKK